MIYYSTSFVLVYHSQKTEKDEEEEERKRKNKNKNNNFFRLFFKTSEKNGVTRTCSSAA